MNDSSKVPYWQIPDYEFFQWKKKLYFKTTGMIAVNMAKRDASEWFGDGRMCEQVEVDIILKLHV